MVRVSERQVEDPSFWDKLGQFMTCLLHGTLFVDREFLEEVNLYEDVEQAFERTGWNWFPNLACDANTEDTREFLASVEEDDEEGLRYRHRGVWYSASMEDFEEVFGWTRATADNVDTHTSREAWSVLTGGEYYISGRCNASSILMPKFFILHRFVSQNILGRKPGCTKPSLNDMEVMKGFLYEKVVPWCSLMWNHWINLSRRSPIFVGGIITYYLQYIHGNERLNHHVICPAEYLNKEKMKRLKAIRVTRGGRIVWTYREGKEPLEASDEEEYSEESSHPLRRCTRAQTRAREGAHQRTNYGSQSAQSSTQGGSSFGTQSTAVPYADPFGHGAHTTYDARAGGQSSTHGLSISPDMNTLMFNLTRVMEYLTPPSVDIAVQPPPDWVPGSRVPEGYHIRDVVPGQQEPPAEDDEDDDDDDGDGTGGSGNSVPWFSDNDWDDDNDE